MRIYSLDGRLQGQWRKDNYKRLAEFDHSYNNLTLGGNRICSSYGNCPRKAHSRYHVNDIVIHDDYIADRYFELSTGRAPLPLTAVIID